MAVNKDEDKALAKASRSAIAKSPLDISELNLSCSGGFVELTGKVRCPRGHIGNMNMRKEFQNLVTIVRSVRGVKDCYGGGVTIIEG